MEQVVNMKRAHFVLASAVLGIWFFFQVSQDVYLYSQSAEYKYLKNYPPEVYNQSPQNWCVIQDGRGIIFIANQGGLLEYDGVSWRTNNIPNIAVRSTAAGSNGTIYVGGNNEFGFFSTDARGRLEYHSLVDRLKPEQRDFATVWRIHRTKEGIYFRTSGFLFRWDRARGKIKAWKSTKEHPYRTSFICGGKLFIRRHNLGLTQMIGDSLELVPGGALFKDKTIYMMAPYDINGARILIGTRNFGLYLYDGQAAAPFQTEADDYLKNNRLYHGIALKSSRGDSDHFAHFTHFALATQLGGLVIIDAGGRLKYIYNKAAGLVNDNVRYLFEDAEGNLWLALNYGISKIEYASPFSIYDERSGLRGLVLSVVKQGKLFYAGTSSGLYVSSSTSIFTPLPVKSANYFHSLLPFNGSLLAGASKGVFLVENKTHVRHMALEVLVHVLHRSTKTPDRVWVGTKKGLYSLFLKTNPGNPDNRWVVEKKIIRIAQQITTIVEDQKGDLWLGTRTSGIIKVDFLPGGSIHQPGITYYHTGDGLPTGELHVFKAAGRVIFASPGKGVFRFETKEKRFIPDHTLGKRYAGSRGVFRIAEDKSGTIWFHSRNRNYMTIPQTGAQTFALPHPLSRIPSAQINVIYPDPRLPATWFGGSHGLIRYHWRKTKRKIKEKIKSDDKKFITLIREVAIKGATMFYDTEEDKYKVDRRREDSSGVVSFRKRDLRFRFAAPFFQAETQTQYRYFLEGFDDGWSDWGPVTWKDYTNLGPGPATFHAQARNALGGISTEASFVFKVLPYWYETLWAIASYVLLTLLAIFLIVRWRSGKLERETKKLEFTVKERTKEINEKNLQLETQTQQLTDQAEKLKEMAEVKSRFFANISHEFRTPLTLIMGPMEQILSDFKGKNAKLERKIKLMLRNSHRLFTLINRLLDLSRLDSGKMRLRLSRQNIIPVLKGITSSFQLIAAQKKLDFSFHAEEEDISLHFDHEKLEDVTCNLLVNAVKFTPKGGKVSVSAGKVPVKEEHFPEGFLELSIADTGPGIPREQLSRIFDRFYQADGMFEHHHPGSGIGLSLTRELIHLHKGRIDVHSRVGENSGTRFIIRLPLGKEHLDPRDIDAQSAILREPGETVDILTAYDLEGEEAPLEEKSSDEKETEKESEKEIILVVEDSADVREYIRSSLEPLYTVMEAEDGKKGIQKAQESIPDLIISDVMMPGTDGFKLCSVLKNDVKTSHIPIILLTAKASEKNILHGFEEGADDYITKPFNTKILLARIKNLIDLRRHFQLTLHREMAKQPAKMPVSKIDVQFLKELREAIEKNLSDPDFNVGQLGKILYMSRATLYRKIHALSGESPVEFLQSYRLKKAAELLENDFGSVLEVSFEVGFASSSYFTRCFKKKFHQLPSDYRKSENH
jgi:signal transduction histidine kinase/DNA-binding response OmpR family regulator